MMDPPREAAKDAVRDCGEAGIRVVMVTGDHAVTAAAIARQLGIGGERPRVLAGDALDRTGDDELAEIVEEVSVFARISPRGKLRIVEALRARGEVVAVTGDGVNDARPSRPPTSARRWADREPRSPRRPPTWS